MNRWLIIHSDYGQLGNRLHTHTNAVAWCLENNVNLINLSFVNYSIGYSNYNGNPIHSLIINKTFISTITFFFLKSELFSRFCRSDRWLNRLKKYFNVFPFDENLTVEENDLNYLFHRMPLKLFTLLRSWNLNVPNLVQKHKNYLHIIFTPISEYSNIAKARIDNLRSKYKILVGVHARRGDYNNYLDGIHFHSWKSYKKWIVQIKKVIEEEKGATVGFVLCSDEIPPPDIFENVPVNFERNNNMMTDIHALSLCDYNFGPPSSFGTWSSWYGTVPRLVVTNDSRIFSLSQFKQTNSC